MSSFGAGVFVGLIMARVFLAFFNGSGAFTVDIDYCDDWTDFFNGCDGPIGALQGFFVGTISGMPVLLNTAQVALQNVLIVFAVRDFVAG